MLRESSYRSKDVPENIKNSIMTRGRLDFDTPTTGLIFRKDSSWSRSVMEREDVSTMTPATKRTDFRDRSITRAKIACHRPESLRQFLWAAACGCEEWR